MTQYIDKSALVAEINKRITDAPINHIGHQRVWAYNDVKDIIDTLEVKEVDLEKEFDKCCENYMFDDECEVYTARKFFELGLKFKSKGE